MMQLTIKFALTAIVVVAVSELAKRSTAAGAMLAALPLTSILAMVWLYQDTRDVEKIASLSDGIFFLVLPTLIFFVMLSALLRRGFGFTKSMVLSSVAMIAIYLGYAHVARKFGAPI